MFGFAILACMHHSMHASSHACSIACTMDEPRIAGFGPQRRTCGTYGRCTLEEKIDGLADKRRVELVVLSLRGDESRWVGMDWDGLGWVGMGRDG